MVAGRLGKETKLRTNKDPAVSFLFFLLLFSLPLSPVCTQKPPKSHSKRMPVFLAQGEGKEVPLGQRLGEILPSFM